MKKTYRKNIQKKYKNYKRLFKCFKIKLLNWKKAKEITKRELGLMKMSGLWPMVNPIKAAQINILGKKHKKKIQDEISILKHFKKKSVICFTLSMNHQIIMISRTWDKIVLFSFQS